MYLVDCQIINLCLLMLIRNGVRAMKTSFRIRCLYKISSQVKPLRPINIIDSDKGMSPVPHQTITRTNDDSLSIGHRESTSVPF